MTSDEFDGVPLTPSHSLYGRIQSLPDAQPKTDKDFNSRELVTRRMRYVAVLLGHFWKRFNKEYLLSLLCPCYRESIRLDLLEMCVLKT